MVISKCVLTVALSICFFVGLRGGLFGQSTLETVPPTIIKATSNTYPSIKIVLPLKFKKKPLTLVWGDADFSGPGIRTIIVKKNGKLTLPDGVVILIPKGTVVFSPELQSPRTVTITLDASAHQDAPASDIK